MEGRDSRELMKIFVSFLKFKVRYERECNRCELLKTRILQLEEELFNRKQQAKILGQLQTDVKRLHSAFDALEVILKNKIFHNLFFSFNP